MKNLSKNFKSGFTLIELLVVVAIIGILASVVLASLNTARAKGADAAIKANLANIRAQAEIVYDGNTPNSYLGVCTEASVASALVAAGTASGTTAVCNVTATTGEAWAASVSLKTVPANSWCVDSLGASKQITGNIASGVTVCPAS